ncbi:MerR family transcriptional regulator [Litoribrevibacter albus]|uniref:Transcriptional regulator n=1 Tax=Litoribrevibacter albus TaxID=1473156 RepID=A0AA37W7E9_9GAMM|nr:MerR family transcriptional regulator [Litoribrevibacter albus]GLQ30386.1 transcriptional regulator [Litoribrevibacter albus]
MKIGELSKITGLASSRIRFYESIGLLQVVKRQANGYRDYPPEAITVLNLIDVAQQAGFTLDELRALLPPDLTQWDHEFLVKALHQKLEDIELLQKKLAENKSKLLEVLKEVEAKPEDMDCDDNARRVLSQFNIG